MRKALRTVRRWAAAYTLNPQYVRLLQQDGCSHPYAWGVLQGARLARSLGLNRISVIEFGVAGGNGLVALEHIAQWAQLEFGLDIVVTGFDRGNGLPEPRDYRDMPNLWQAGAFAMDEARLRTRLQGAQLVLGDVGQTLSAYLISSPPPVAFLAFDLDLYHSTVAALKLLEADQVLLLPRVHCYFDDILGYTFGDHVGERLAIAEFNNSHSKRKISPIYGLRYYAPSCFANEPMWEKYFMAHLFDHDAYSKPDGLIEPEGIHSLRHR